MLKPAQLAAALALFAASAFADPPREPARHFTAADVFNLEYANSLKSLPMANGSPMFASPAMS